MTTPVQRQTVRTGHSLSRESEPHRCAADTSSVVREADEEGLLALTDGSPVPFRPIRPDDAASLQHFHRRLSAHSVHLRFFGAKPELSDKKAEYFTHVDGANRFALVALDPWHPEEIIAVASFDREALSDRAEYAAAVEDRWQGRGLGLALTRRLIEAALKRGIRRFGAIVLPENIRMLNLMRDLGLPERIHCEYGVEAVEIDLRPERSSEDLAEAGEAAPG